MSVNFLSLIILYQSPSNSVNKRWKYAFVHCVQKLEYTHISTRENKNKNASDSFPKDFLRDELPRRVLIPSFLYLCLLIEVEEVRGGFIVALEEMEPGIHFDFVASKLPSEPKQ